MKSLRWAAVVVTAPLACALLLAGCSSDDKKSENPARTSTTDRMVKIGDRSLHLRCTGSGAPTVVLESGLGGHQSTWDEVVPAVKAKSRVCTYSRANVPPSDALSGKHTAADSVADLHALLEAADEDGPYVLVGFSFGGLITQLYAAEHPDDIAGLVLVESNHPDEVDQFEQHLTAKQIADDRAAANGNPEGFELFDSFLEVQQAGDLPDVPLVVVTAKEPDGWPPGWDPELFDRLRAQQQSDLAASVAGGTQVIADQSGHDVPREQPEVVVTAISTGLAGS